MGTAEALRDSEKAQAPAARITPPGRWLELDLRELWAHREILYFLVWKEVKVRYKQTAIGAAWAVVQPVMTMVVFTIFFGHLLGVPTNGIPKPIFYYSALLPWTYFANALTSATNAVVANQHVITKIYFPRLILPLAAVVPGLLDMAIAFTILIGMMVVYGVTPNAGILLLPFFLLLVVATALGIGLWLSALNAIYRDVRYVQTFLVQLWFFLSPVVYPVSEIPERFRWVYGLNPLAGVVEGFRWALTGNGEAPTTVIFVSASVVLALLVGGLFFFRRKETVIADVV